VWLPIIADGSSVRFAQTPEDVEKPSADWSSPRVAYLQNASDPVAWFDPAMIWRRPDFLDDPRGPDVSPDMRWIPVVSFWQVLLDLPAASGVPAGHGHRYGSLVVDGWAVVLQPEGWTDHDTTRLREELEQRNG
jgi:uncharacterized membrane protein